MTKLANLYREKSATELNKLLQETKKKIAVEQMRDLGSKSKNTHIVSQLRRTVAVIKTFIRMAA